MKDKDDKIIYVGKAISLKNRVRQYFRKNNKTARIEKMVSLIDHFEYIVVDNEAEALILECNLIKKNRPKFNVLLKDDKSYPYIKVALKEEYPKEQRLYLEEGNFNCNELKYIISKATILVAARTHASIAAYSTEIPTLVIGYSVKSKGIAQDIFGNYDDYVISKDELKNNNYILQYNEAYGNSFTAPLSFLNAHQDTIYNEASIIKMSILSIIYFIISFFTFKIRKMENNEISFHSELMHYFIKTLVFIPIGFVCYAIMYDGGNGSILIAIAGALIYYIVYDLITRKNIFKLRKSLIICFISFAFITGSFYLYHKSIEDKHIYLENIEKISFYHAGEYLNISDAKIINEIIKTSVNNNGYMSGRIAIFEKNHKYYSTYININENLNKTINQYILKRNISLATTYNYNSIDSVSHKIPLTKEFKKLAKDTMSYLKIDDLRNASKTISVYDYSNHAYQKLVIPYTLNEELDKYVLTSFNNRFIDFVSDYNNKNSINFVIESSLFNSQESYVFNYVINSNLSSFIDYIKENNYKTIDKEICCIYYNGNTVLEIGDAKKLYDEFKKYEDKVKNTLEYQSIVKKFNEVYSNTDYEY